MKEQRKKEAQEKKKKMDIWTHTEKEKGGFNKKERECGRLIKNDNELMNDDKRRTEILVGLMMIFMAKENTFLRIQYRTELFWWSFTMMNSWFDKDREVRCSWKYELSLF